MRIHVTPVVRAVALVTLLSVAAIPLVAQEFVPPDRGHPTPPASAPGPRNHDGFRLDILGFSTRAGFQVNNGGQFLLGSTVDLIQLGIPQVRGRTSFEFGFGTPSTIGINEEVMYRFLADTASAIPYIGVGVGYLDDNTVKRVWPTVAIGFELPFRRTMNWLVEYHALDALRRSRFFIGLATRGG